MSEHLERVYCRGNKKIGGKTRLTTMRASVCALCVRICLSKPGINLRRKIRVNRGSAARKGVKGSRVP